LLGTIMDENAISIAVDANCNCYITGSTSGTLDSDTFIRGSRRPFVAKYNTDGELLWLDQLRQGSAQEGHAISVQADGTIYTAGKPGYIARHDPNGVLIDIKISSMSDYCGANFDGQGNLYACGWTADITGYMEKYNQTGQRLWRRQFREAGWTAPKYVVMCTDGSGDVLTGGCQQGPRGGNDCQAFIRKFDVDGNQTMRYDHPASVSTCGYRVGVDNAGSCLLTGGKNARDAFAIKLGYPDNISEQNILEIDSADITEKEKTDKKNTQCPCSCLTDSSDLMKKE
jgi:hypothetical protein